MSLILNTLTGNPSSDLPIWLMRQAGRYLPEYRAIREKVAGFMDLCFDENLATEVSLQPLRRFDLDAAILFSDILVIPHVLGQRVQVLENQGPVLNPINANIFFDQAQDVDIPEALSIPLKVLSNVRKSLPSTKAVFGFAGSPWTIATYMLEGGKSTTFDRILTLMGNQDPLFTQTMKLLEESVGTFLIAQIQAGADVIQIFDTWAKAVPIHQRKKWIIDPVRRIISRVQTTCPSTPIIYYGRGVTEIYPLIAEGMSNIAFGVDETISLSHMKNNLQKLAPLQGNLCPHILVEGGHKKRSQVKDLISTFRGTPYIFNLGHGIVPQTPVEHVSELIELVKERNFHP